MEMADYAQLMPRLIPQLVPAPQFVLTDALQTVAVDFFTRSEVWRGVFEEIVGEGEREIQISVPRGQGIVRVLGLWLDGEQLRPDEDFSFAVASIMLASPACRDMQAKITASLKPGRMATKIPASSMEEWGDVLVFGTLAKVKSMTGPRIDWTDAAGAQLNMGLYEQGLAQARIRLLRGRDRRSLRIN